MIRYKVAYGLIAVGAIAGIAAFAPAAQADTRVDDRSGTAAVRATADDPEAPRADGSITFRTERYHLSDRAVVTTTPTTIRIVDDSARTQQGEKTSLYVQFGYTFDADKRNVIRVNSGVAIRGYDFADGTYDKSQAIQLGQSTLSIDSSNWSQATHAWGHLNSPIERGIDLDIHGLHFWQP
jgi:hypothetical protein